MRLFRLVCCLCLVEALCIGTAGAVTSYVLTDLGELVPDEDSSAAALNEASQVVGFARVPESMGTHHAFFWDNGTMVDLGPADRRHYASDINNASGSYGYIVGSVHVGVNQPIAHVWTRTGSFPLGSFGGGESEALGVNDAGVIVGWSQDLSGNWHAFRWANGYMQDLGTLGGRQSCAFSINESGVIAGWAYTSIDSHACVWDGGSTIDLGTFGGPDSAANDVNDLGQVVGSADRPGGWQYKHAFLWQGDDLIDLGTLGGEASEALAVNNHGQIVGWAQGSGPGGGACLWEDGTVYRLHELLINGDGWRLSKATDINDSGCIVGYGDHNIAGHVVTHAFLLTPIPEPGTLSVVGLAGLALLLRRRKA